MFLYVLCTGQHIETALAGVKPADRCTCPRDEKNNPKSIANQ